MENKNVHKWDPKWINKLFIWIAFVCVFIFTVSFSIKQVKENIMWWGISFAITIVVVAAIWITLFFIAKKKSMSDNDIKIKKVIEKEED